MSASMRGPWGGGEDAALISAVAMHGPCRWSRIVFTMDDLLGRPRGSGRNARQARDRYVQHLAPDLKPAGAWSLQEESTLIRGHRRWGRSWARLAQMLPGRSAAAIKNHWYSTMRRRVPADVETMTNLQRYIRSGTAAALEEGHQRGIYPEEAGWGSDGACSDDASTEQEARPDATWALAAHLLSQRRHPQDAQAAAAALEGDEVAAMTGQQQEEEEEGEEEMELGAHRGEEEAAATGPSAEAEGEGSALDVASTLLSLRRAVAAPAAAGGGPLRSAAAAKGASCARAGGAAAGDADLAPAKSLGDSSFSSASVLPPSPAYEAAQSHAPPPGRPAAAAAATASPPPAAAAAAASLPGLPRQQPQQPQRHGGSPSLGLAAEGANSAVVAALLAQLMAEQQLPATQAPAAMGAFPGGAPAPGLRQQLLLRQAQQHQQQYQQQPSLARAMSSPATMAMPLVTAAAAGHGVGGPPSPVAASGFKRRNATLHLGPFRRNKPGRVDSFTSAGVQQPSQQLKLRHRRWGVGAGGGGGVTQAAAAPSLASGAVGSPTRPPPPPQQHQQQLGMGCAMMAPAGMGVWPMVTGMPCASAAPAAALQRLGSMQQQQQQQRQPPPDMLGEALAQQLLRQMSESLRQHQAAALAAEAAPAAPGAGSAPAWLLHAAAPPPPAPAAPALASEVLRPQPSPGAAAGATDASQHELVARLMRLLSQSLVHAG